MQAGSNPSSEARGRLPLEILHMILQYLDKKTLSSFSLAGRSWLNHARRYLFQSIDYYHMHEDVAGLAEDPRPPLQDFLVFLEATPAICAHIYSLSLTMKSTIEIGWHGRLTPDVLFTVLRLIPNLRTLKMYNLHFEDLDSALRLALTHGPAINHLDILYIEDESYHSGYLGMPAIHTLRLLTFFGTVNNLTFNFRYDEYDRSAVHLPPHRRTRVANLQVSAPLTPHDLAMIDVEHLESYTIDAIHGPSRHFAELQKTLARAAVSLRHLHLPLGSSLPVGRHDPLADTYDLLLDLAAARALRTVAFALTAYAPDTLDAPGIGLCPMEYGFVVQSVPALSDTLRTLTLELCRCKNSWMLFLGPPRSENRMDWATLDDALVRRAAEKELWEVRVVLKGFPHPEKTRRDVEKALPRTGAMGVLGFKWNVEGPRVNVNAD